MKNQTIQSLSFLLGQSKKHFPLFLLALSCTALLVVGNLSISHIMRYGVDAIMEQQTQFFATFAWSLLALVVFIAIITFLERFLIGRYTELSLATLRERLINKINNLPIAYLDNQHSGDLTSRVTNDVHVVREFVLHHLLPLVFMPAMALAALSYMLTMHWQLTLISIGLAPLLGVLVSQVAKPMQGASAQLQTSLSEVNSQAQDTLAGMPVVKAFGLEETQQMKYGEKVRLTLVHGVKLAKQRSIMQSVSNLAGVIPFLVCFGYGGYLAANEVITVGALIAFINLLNHVSGPLESLPRLIGEAHTAVAACQRIQETLALSSERETGRDFSLDPDPILSFNDVSFQYNDEPILRNLSFTIHKGETVAVVGPSGGGKSTILKLICGFYPPQKGEIYLGNHNISEWNLTLLREKMALVTQETYLYPGSIQTNIRYGKLEATELAIAEAASKANAQGFITSLPNGYQTQVGERGSRLSGGQKQRIAIARAIIKNPEILLLDEPTSALDTESESLVQQALEGFMQDKTTLVIAHRLSTIKNADRVLVVDQGEIVEQGTHQELLERQGAYYRLYENQFTHQQPAV